MPKDELWSTLNASKPIKKIKKYFQIKESRDQKKSLQANKRRW